MPHHELKFLDSLNTLEQAQILIIGLPLKVLNTGNVKQLITIVGSCANIQAGQPLKTLGHTKSDCQNKLMI